MIDKTPYIEKFKQVFEEQYKQEISYDTAVEYFEILSAYYAIALQWLEPIDKDE